MIEINPQELNFNAYQDIKNKWFLLTAEKDGKVNTMTCSWGMAGNLWNAPTFLTVVRKSRFTKEFLDGAERFSISFFDGYEKELGYLGSHSGRDGDKISAVDFHVAHEDGVPYFKEAETVFFCTKTFVSDMDKCSFIDPTVVEKWYSGTEQGNYHTIYFGRIDKILAE